MISDQALGLREKKWMEKSLDLEVKIEPVYPISVQRSGSFCFLVPSNIEELIALYQEIKSVVFENERATIVLISLEDNSLKNAFGLRKTLKDKLGCDVQIQREVL